MKFVGIDYSMSCPAICVYESSGKSCLPEFGDCTVHVLTSRTKFLSTPRAFANIHCTKNVYTSDIGDPEKRFDLISNWAIPFVHRADKVVIEDYSMGSKGKVFHIAENTGLFKYKLWKEGIAFTTVPPTVLKKFATGKGNANKDAMYAAFLALYPQFDLQSVFKETKIASPISDIVDSFFFCRYAATVA